MAPIIKVQNLSKEYVIGRSLHRANNVRELIVEALRKPFRALHGGCDAEEATNPPTFWALKDVSFDVQQGEILGIIGRNGAGKSTLLKILSRITDPTKGRVRMRGRLASLLEVGTGFHPELTGRENIYLNGAVLGLRKSEIDANFDNIVAFSEIGKFLDTPVKRYSSGMYVRLAFAVAAHLTPEILIVDEVLAVGDAGFQKKCLGKMSEVATAGRTVLFVSHNMAAVAQLCTKAIWLDQGQVRLVATPDEVIRAYLEAGSKHIGERQWPDPNSAPGDHRVRLLGLRLLQNDQPTTVVDINKPCRVEFDFQTLCPSENLLTGVYFYSQHNICLFHNNDWRPNLLQPGRYVKNVEIPAQVFAEGTTSVMVQLAFSGLVKCVQIADALTFDAVDSNDPNAIRGLYKGKWEGVVRLALRWSDATRWCAEPARVGVAPGECS